MVRVGITALAYFAAMFMTGFLLGIIRVLWLVPAVGERYAELIEMPLILAVSYVMAGVLTKRLFIEQVGAALTVGVLALLLMISLEFTLVLAIRGLTLAEYFMTRDPIAGSVYLVALLLFAFFPALHCLNRVKRSKTGL